MDLSALTNLAIAAKEKAVTEKGTRYKTVPEKGDFIITKNGGIYYSEAFKKELTVTEGLKSLDMVDGRLINFNKGEKVPFLFVGILSHGAKVASIKGIEGKSSFGKRLVVTLSELYQIDWNTTKEVEFSLLRDRAVEGYNGIHYLPYINKKGEVDVVRRENIELYPCIPTSYLPKEEPVKVDAVQKEIEFEVTPE